MSTIQIVSDLHLELESSYDSFTITPKAPILALLGDIGSVKDLGYLSFLRTQLANFRCVLHVPGNHEPYRSDRHATIETLRTFESEVRKERVMSPHSEVGKYVLLDRKAYYVPDANVVVLGCTLFSNVPHEAMRAVSFGIQDFAQTDNWTVEEHTAAHLDDVAWLNHMVETIPAASPGSKIVVLTHYSPTVDARAVEPRHAGSVVSSAFASDLRGQRCWEDRVVKMWAFGHTHYNCDFRDESTGKRVYSNQRGYVFEDVKGFDAGHVVDLEDL